MASPADRRLLHDLNAVAALLDDGHTPADERLASTVGQDRLRELRSQMQCPGEARRATVLVRAAARFSRLKQWQWSLFIVSLGCGVAVSMMGIIDLIWQFRSVLSGLGAVALVLTVFLKTRHQQRLETWIGS